MKFTSAAPLALTTWFVAFVTETTAFALPLDTRAVSNPIVGLPANPDGSRPFRLELNQFIQNADQFNMFLLGLQAMQSTTYTNPNSFYAIAGIHGRPYTGWNGEKATGVTNSGYCTHSSILFPTWHRPYLAAYEQAIFAAMQAQVKLFPAANQARWQSALNGFRIPYWDWATNNAQMPSVLTNPSATVTTPNNAKATIANPLFSFNFPNGVSRADFPDSPLYTWKTTLRYPTNQKSTATSQNARVNSQLAQNAASLQQRVYQLFVNSAYQTYAAVSNKAANVDAPDSLEAVHDVLHGLTGNGGHMSYVDYSAFDPIFFLHHANIDRIFAIWQALNPDAWLITGQANPYGTYGVPAGTVETATTALTPFRNAAGNLFTSNDIRSTAVFGYSYPEIPDWQFNGDAAGLSNYVQAQVQSLYGGTANSLAASNKRRDVGNETAEALDASVVNSFYYDWRVDVESNKMVLGASYFVHIFIGQPVADPAQWSSQPELAGDYVVFVNKMQMPSNDGVCGVKENIISGSVPVTQALIDRAGDIGSLNPDDVVAYLQKNMTWRVSLMDDSSVTVGDVCDLKITVSASKVKLPPKGQETTTFPEFGPYELYAEITHGKVGGAPIKPSI